MYLFPLSGTKLQLHQIFSHRAGSKLVSKWLDNIILIRIRTIACSRAQTSIYINKRRWSVNKLNSAMAMQMTTQRKFVAR